MTLEEFQIRNGIETIYNFIDPTLHCPSRAYRDRSAFARPDERILLHISNFRPVKRVLDTVRILERVVKGGVPAVLLMVGDGPERSSAQALARRLGLADRVKFLGTRETVEEIAALADVFLLPSELESFGLSALEAMACAVPVVGSDAGGLPEVVANGECGYLLPVGDVDGMAARVLGLLRDEKQRKAMGCAGRRRAEEHFNVEAIVTQYERHYERVLGR
jgi:N-acetyl-alpha-D-glucosaminyl L-malate synthase BshA